MSKAASVAFLQELHGAFAKYLTDMLKEAQRVDDEGNPVGLPLDAASMGVIERFLGKNSITADPIAKEDLDALREQFSRTKQGVSGSASAAVRAAMQDGNDTLQ